MQDLPSRHDLEYTERLSNQNISEQGEKLYFEISLLCTSIKDQSERIAMLTKTLTDQRHEFSREIAEEVALNIRREHDRAKQLRSDVIMPWLFGAGSGLLLCLTIFNL